MLKGKLRNPGTKSFDTVAEASVDPLICAKLACFASIAKVVEKFLISYQTDKVMIPLSGFRCSQNSQKTDEKVHEAYSTG